MATRPNLYRDREDTQYGVAMADAQPDRSREDTYVVGEFAH